MCAQFGDHREWIREYVTNALDAGATRVDIDFVDHGAELTVRVRDDGRGMDREGVRRFFTICQSDKESDPGAVGQHGLGAISILAIPELSRFSMHTSAGHEVWYLETSSLGDGAPLEVVRHRSDGSHGTTFEVTFKRGCSVREELDALYRVLRRYVRYLPLEITFTGVDAGGSRSSRTIQQSWRSTDAEAYLTATDIDGERFDVALGLGQASHEVYQNRVLITGRYDLLALDGGPPLEAPHLHIRVDSPGFELPFGRHCLRNEQILEPLARRLRREVLPRFMEQICERLRLDALGDWTTGAEALVCAMLGPDDDAFSACARVPLFDDVNNARHSLAALRQAVATTGRLFLAHADVAALDQTSMEGPVLLADQLPGGLELLRARFQGQLIDLGGADQLMEVPLQASRQEPQGLRFQTHLRFHRAALGAMERTASSGERGRTTWGPKENGASEEVQRACVTAASLRWRVSLLQNRADGQPCTARRVMVRDGAVVLNLHHPEIARLVRLSATAPELAGHWGLAIALSDLGGEVLPHFSPEARQDLIQMDAMAKCLGHTPAPREAASEAQDEAWRGFLRRAAAHRRNR